MDQTPKKIGTIPVGIAQAVGEVWRKSGQNMDATIEESVLEDEVAKYLATKIEGGTRSTLIGYAVDFVIAGPTMEDRGMQGYADRLALGVEHLRKDGSDPTWFTANTRHPV